MDKNKYSMLIFACYENNGKLETSLVDYDISLYNQLPSLYIVQIKESNSIKAGLFIKTNISHNDPELSEAITKHINNTHQISHLLDKEIQLLVNKIKLKDKTVRLDSAKLELIYVEIKQQLQLAR